MGPILGFIISLVVAAVVILIVSKLNLGLHVNGLVAAIIAALVIAIVGSVVVWLLGVLRHYPRRRADRGDHHADHRGCCPDDQRQVRAGHDGQGVQRGHHRGHRASPWSTGSWA